MKKDKAPPKKILIVEDDDFLRASLLENLKLAGYEAKCASDGAQARQLLSLEPFDAVLSDLKMPNVNGLQLLFWTKEHQPLPFILMTGFPDLAESLDAEKSGAVALLIKPFKSANLLEALASCFPTATVDDSMEPGDEDVDDQYCKVALDDFVSGSDIRYDIFVRLSEKKYVRIAHCGQDISLEQIKSYKEKGVFHLYMQKSDFRSYVSFNTKLVRTVAQSSKITKIKKLNFLKHTAEILSASIFSDMPDEEGVANAKSVVETSVQLLQDHDDAIAVLELLNSHADFVYSHSVAVSFYSVLLARKLKWKSTSNFFKLSTGALFHDIGKKEIPRDILFKPRKSLTVEETTFIESHTVRGAEILSQLPDLPNDAVQIASQHHENCVGFGFPRRLRKEKISPARKSSRGGQ